MVTLPESIAGTAGCECTNSQWRRTLLESSRVHTSKPQYPWSAYSAPWSPSPDGGGHAQHRPRCPRQRRLPRWTALGPAQRRACHLCPLVLVLSTGGRRTLPPDTLSWPGLNNHPPAVGLYYLKWNGEAARCPPTIHKPRRIDEHHDGLAT